MTQVVKKEFVCKHSDLNKIGVELGYEWNDVCKMVQKAGIYGEDGSGAYYLSVEGFEEGYFENPERGIHQILHELLKQSNFEDIKILN